MANQYREVKQLNLPEIDQEISQFWEEKNIFQRSITEKDSDKPFVFYEGPPSANGMPGIHHVMGRAIKDLFCRFKTMQGYQVKRKGGWDTHGLPVELKVENELGITKEDIGSKISVEEYNEKCKTTVMRYKDVWDDLTKKMGYWVDLENPYITFTNEYIERVWSLLKQIYDKDLMYKGYTIQPYSPAAGTGLSSHELNQPGAYKDVSDTSAVAQFRLVHNEKSAFLFDTEQEDVCFIAWTTTPWTLPSNTALAVGKNIEYVKVKTSNPYTKEPVSIILAKELLAQWKLSEEDIVQSVIGSQLQGISYRQLLAYKQPTTGDAFRVIIGDFVTTSDGTGIVHIAPSFGADDKRIAEENGIGSLTLVDTQGRFVDGVGEFSGRYVKNYTDDVNYKNVDVDICILLKQENKAFNVQKYKHNYPHCWRTDKPIIYYPLDSWFIRTTAVKEQLIANNNTINWKPASTGEGRFGKWLEDLKDWNLSRSRFWGIPLPIWRSDDGTEQLCIGSVEELNEKMQIANQQLGLNNQPLTDLHRPFIDEIILVSDSGKRMTRETDVIDVWFDSGSMPYASDDLFDGNKPPTDFPADFIAEGVDQTRGWFFTLHAIATMVYDSVAFKNVVSNGLVLDKNGQKMSKRLGNAVDPFETLQKYGADATRWYMISNAQPWDNLKFDTAGIEETQRKLFGTLFNTYSFFSMYANIDGFTYQEAEISLPERPEIDQWILSKLHSLISETQTQYNDYEPTKATRAIQQFVIDDLSNWYVRLCRRRFWKGEYTTDKISAYQTLYTCLQTVVQLMAPVAPFFSEFIFSALNQATQKLTTDSVHLSSFPQANQSFINQGLEEQMQLAQDASSLVLSLRKKEEIKVRQPLSKILIPILSEKQKQLLQNVEDLILSEVNVKQIEYVTDTSGMITKTIKPNYKVLGKKLGKQMKEVAQAFQSFSQKDIQAIETSGTHEMQLNGETISIALDEVEIVTSDLEGWLVANTDKVTVALDITLTPSLIQEGHARELVNRIQTMRKDKDFAITDRIKVSICCNQDIQDAIHTYQDYISTEVLADAVILTEEKIGEKVDINSVDTYLTIEK